LGKACIDRWISKDPMDKFELYTSMVSRIDESEDENDVIFRDMMSINKQLKMNVDVLENERATFYNANLIQNKDLQARDSTIKG